MTGKLNSACPANIRGSSIEPTPFVDMQQNGAISRDSSELQLLEHCFTSTIFRALIEDRLVVGMARCAQELDCEGASAMICVVPEDMNALFMTLVSSGCRVAGVPLAQVSRLDALAKRYGFYFDDEMLAFDCLLILKPAELTREECILDQYLAIRGNQDNPIDLPWT